MADKKDILPGERFRFVNANGKDPWSGRSVVVKDVLPENHWLFPGFVKIRLEFEDPNYTGEDSEGLADPEELEYISPSDPIIHF